MGIIQRDRIYKLIVGDYKTERGVLIETLHVTFEVSKSSDNKKKSNSAAIEIYNLSDDTLKKFETEFIRCEFYCGYKDVGLKRLFAGDVTQVTTRKNGTDKVTQLLLGEGYVALNHTTLSETVPDNKTVAEAFEAIRKQMPGVVRGIYAGTNINNLIPFGYPLTGTAKQMLQELSETYRVEYSIEQDTLSLRDESGVSDKNKTTAFVISEQTGLIDIPYYTSPSATKTKGDNTRKEGVQFKALLNTEIIPGKMIYLKSKAITGYFKVTSTRHYGGFRDNDWYVECFCEVMKDKDFQ